METKEIVAAILTLGTLDRATLAATAQAATHEENTAIAIVERYGLVLSHLRQLQP